MSKRMQCKRSFEIIFFKYKNNRIFQKYLYSQQICSEGNLLIVYVVWVEVRHLQLRASGQEAEIMQQLPKRPSAVLLELSPKRRP